MHKREWRRLLLWIAVVEAIGLLAWWLAGDIGAVYQSLIKPPMALPGWLFGVVWPAMYALMGIAAYWVHRSHDPLWQRALVWFGWQLLLNLLWCLLFFRLRVEWLANLEILLLDVVAGVTLLHFSRIDRRAGLLLMPYAIWLLYATYLSIGFSVVN